MQTYPVWGYTVTQYTGHISANTKPHHMCLGDWEMGLGTAINTQNAGILFCSSKTCWLGAQWKHAIVQVTWLGKWFDFHCWPALKQVYNKPKQIHKYTYIYVITWPRTGTFGIHNTYMYLISDLNSYLNNYRLSWDSMTTKWSWGFRIYIIMKDTVDQSHNGIVATVWMGALRWLVGYTSFTTVLIRYLK